MENLMDAEKVVGTRTLTKAIRAGQIAKAYIALDADLFITRQITELCQEMRVPVVEIRSMEELGKACGVQVKTAAAGIKR